MGARVLACVLPDLLKVFQHAEVKHVSRTNGLPAIFEASAPPVLDGNKFKLASQPIAEGSEELYDVEGDVDVQRPEYS